MHIIKSSKNIQYRTKAKYKGKPNPKNYNYLGFYERGIGFFIIWWKQQLQNCKLSWSSLTTPILDARPCFAARSQFGLIYLETGGSTFAYFIELTFILNEILSKISLLFIIKKLRYNRSTKYSDFIC